MAASFIYYNKGMPPAGPVISEKLPVTSGGGGFHPPTYDEGGDDQGSGGSPDYGRRLRRARMGLVIALAPILMLFLTITVAYILRHGSLSFDERTNSYVRDWIHVNLPTRLLLINTILLFASSITIEMARRRIAGDVALSPVRSIPGILIGRERGFPWLAITALLGIAFLCGQGMAWRVFFLRGFYLSSNASSSFVYLLTAAHAIHLAGGVVVLLYALTVYFLHQPVESRHIVVDVTAWYWHFMLFLWIYIFALLEFLR